MAAEPIPATSGACISSLLSRAFSCTRSACFGKLMYLGRAGKLMCWGYCQPTRDGSLSPGASFWGWFLRRSLSGLWAPTAVCSSLISYSGFFLSLLPHCASGITSQINYLCSNPSQGLLLRNPKTNTKSHCYFCLLLCVCSYNKTHSRCGFQWVWESLSHTN